MELDLRRVDYLQVASVSRGTLQLLASQKSGTQKVVVGDDTGAITCFAIKKGEVRQGTVRLAAARRVGFRWRMFSLRQQRSSTRQLGELCLEGKISIRSL